jgi:uncharacterized membrane protein
MSVVEASTDVEATREQVWRVVADPRNLPRWDRHITGVEDVPDGGLRPGTSYVTEVRFMGVRAKATAHVIELRESEYSKVRLRGMVDAVIETWLEPLGEKRTRLRHRVEYRFPGGSLGALAGRAVGMLGANSILKRGVVAQKRQVEREAS